MEWELVAEEFAWDGSLRDVCIPGTTIADWECLLSDMRTWNWPMDCTLDGAACSLPQTAEAAFALSRDATLVLSTSVAGMLFNCHFFSVDEIELDLDPREVRGQGELDVLLSFMRRLSVVTGKPVLLTPENWRGEPILRMLPSDGSVQFHDRRSREDGLR